MSCPLNLDFRIRNAEFNFAPRIPHSERSVSGGYYLFLVVTLLSGLVVLPSIQGAEYKLVGTFHVAIKNPSGLAYDPVHDSLWTVQDNGGGRFAIGKKGDRAFLFEIDKKGNVLKKVPLKSNDLEGIAYRPDTDTFLLAEERRREIVEVNRAGKVLRTIKVSIDWNYWNLNYGIEGVAYDPKGKSIFVANEKKPKRIMEIKGDGRIVNFFEVIQVADISDLYYDPIADRLLVLSHESKAVLELNMKGKLLTSLLIGATKAEGITKDSKGYLYIICEATSILYVYAPEVVPTSWSGDGKSLPQAIKSAK